MQRAPGHLAAPPRIRRRSTSALLATALGLGVVAATAAPAAAAPASQWVINGPSPVQGRLTLDADGSLALAVRSAGQDLYTVGDLGVVTDEADLSRGLRFLDRKIRPVHDRYTMIAGKQQERRYDATETVLSFAGDGGARLDLVVRISDDGLAYRYVLPGDGEHTVRAETATTTFARDGRAWNQSGYAVNYEAEWVERTAAGNVAGAIGYPALVEAAPGTYTLLTEADVDGRYAGSHLTHAAGSLTYGTELFEGRPVTADGPLATPWRTTVIGDLGTVTTSTLVDDLAQSSRLADTSWIRPGVSSWSWLMEHDSPRSEARQRDYVDLAARNGWEYVLLDEGWDASWVPRITRYANAQGVGTIVWFHSRDLWTQEQRDAWLPRLREWGVAGIKVDFMDRDAQATHQWYDAILADTAAQHLMINFHGASLPHGLQRTWPHIMSYEAVRGAENGINPTRSLIVPFTRGVVGSMDWTPVTFSCGNGNSSKAHELAMSVVYESAWQHVSDTPESYAREPIAETFLQDLPTTWDQTALVSGTPGHDVVLARRHGDTWWVGGMRAGSGPAMTVPLAFLGDRATRWLVEGAVDDGGNGSVLGTTSGEHLPTETLSFPTAANGGFALVACPATPGRTTCHEPVQPTAVLDVQATPDTAELESGDTLTVTASATVTSGTGSDVSFGPRVPAGWSVDAGPVTRTAIAAGDRLEGSWTLTVGEDAVRGDVPLAVGARFTSGGREVFAADAVDVFLAPDAPTVSTYVSDLPWLESTSGWTPTKRDTSIDGNPLRLGGKTYTKGVGTHAPSRVTVWLGGECDVFSAVVGIDQEVNKPAEASVRFRVLGDGKVITESQLLRGTSAPAQLVADTGGVRRLTLEVTDGGDGKNSDHGDWADARVWCGGDPAAPTPPAEAPALTGTPYVSDLAWTDEANGWGPIERDRSNGESARGDGLPLTIQGTTYAKGVGTHATSSLTAWLGRGCTRFTAVAGIDDEVLAPDGDPGTGSVVFSVYGDGLLLAQTPVVTNDTGPVALDVDVTGVRRLTLQVGEATNGKNFDHADWADARLTCG